MTAADILTAGGLANADVIVLAAYQVGVPLEIAAALIEKESRGRNIYGHDVGGIFSLPPGQNLEVTPANYEQFLRRVLAGEKSNGVGPAQITYPGYFRQYPDYPFWDPLANIKFGLTILADHLNGDYSNESVSAAGAHYNGGTNPDARALAYGADLATKTRTWRARLSAAKPEEHTVARIAVSPSTQTWNQYTGIATNEQEQAYRQAEVFARILGEHGVETRIMSRGKGDAGTGYVKNAQESNDTGPWDAHICLHTDAGGATGTSGFHYPGDDDGRRLAQAIYDELAPISPGADHGVRARSDLYELNSTSTHAVLMEAAPHDRAASARWIVDNPEAIGAAYARGTLRWLGIPYHNQPTNDVEDIMSTPEVIALLTKIESNTRWGADQLTPGKTGVKNTGETWAQLDAISRKLDALAKAQPGRDDAQDKAIAQLRTDIEAKLAAAQVAFLAALDEIRAMLPGQEG